MKLTFLGTGTSTGVPEIACPCEVCNSTDPHDRRMRSSALLETQGKNILIDCGPDFRWQAISNHITHLDAVLVTHEHYDHVGGLDDLRPFCKDAAVGIYAEDYVADAIICRMPYCFRSNKYPGVPNLELHAIHQPFTAAGIEVIPIRVMHGRLPIFGYRLGDMAYLTDLKYLPEEEYEKLEGLDVLVLTALRLDEKHPTHEGLYTALERIERIRPKEAYLTHMSHKIGLQAETEKELPPHVHFATDGLTITF